MFKEVTFLTSSTSLSQCPKASIPEYAFIGRSNVGKSSLINTLFHRKELAKTSATPGKTKLINHFVVDAKWCLVDLPGYGWAKVSKKLKDAWDKNLQEYILHRTQLKCVFVLIDSRIPAQKIDLEFMEWLGLNNIPFLIIFTKTDKLSKSQLRKALEAYKKTMLLQWEEMPNYFITSSISKIGREDILSYINELNSLEFNS